ncbi:toxin VasX [Marinobacter nauticus]|uniref:Toxin VasX N-terminal region domain-containing protein n=1 Tax=Marinobacter nauticus TaxID=2743 RepID=A0A1M2UUA4_MARNT|nr:toxin VasX [Marinobacter nauticus]OJS98925.1 hypothetical protein BEE62_01720 [Marinobacter nauticus]
MGIKIPDPVAAGDRQSHADITTEGACPLTRTDIQLIPVRYAYADKPADHNALKPRYELAFQPIGVRQVRDGYFYLFHSKAPDILHEYEVRDGGAVTKRLWAGDEAAQDQRTGMPDTPAIIVPREGHIDVLFSATQLTAKKCSMLIRWRSYRSEVMKRVELNGYCPVSGKSHLLNKPDLEELLNRPIENAVPMDGQSYLAPWYWSQDTLDGAQEPFCHRLAEYEVDHAYLLVDDLAGHIADLLDAWSIVDANHNAWLEKEDVRYYPACFISDLIRLDSERIGEIAAVFAEKMNDGDAKVVFSKIAAASGNQKADLKRLIEDFPEYRISARKANGPNLYSYLPADQERVKAMRGSADSLARDLGIEQAQLMSAIEAMSDYQINLVDGSTLGGQRGIADLVRLDEMNAYLEQSQHHLSWFDDEKQRIVSDIQTLLESFYLHGYLHDRAEQEDYAVLLGMDNALITVLSEWSQSNGDFSFLKRFYFEEVGHQHLISLDLKPEIIPGTAKDLIDALKSLMEAMSGPAAYREWTKLVDDSPYLQFPELTPDSAQLLSHNLASKGIIARLAIFELVQKVDAADLQGRLRQLFQQMPEGLKTHIFENQRLYQLDLDIADAGSLARYESLVTEIEQLAQLHDDALSEEKRLEQRRSEASTRERRRNKYEYDEAIGHARERKQMYAAQLREKGFRLMDTSPIEGDSHTGALLINGIARTAYGRAVRSEIEELKRLRQRGGVTRMLDYGRGMIHSQDAMDLPKRIGGIGLVSFMGMIGAVGTWDAYIKWQKEQSLDNFLPLFAGVSGTLGAAASVMTIVGSARLNYYYQTVSQADPVLNRLARVNVWGGTIAAWAGFFSAAADWVKQMNVLRSDSHGSGAKVAALTTLAGDSMLMVGSGRMAFSGSAGIISLWKGTERVTWKTVSSKMLNLAGGVFRGLNAYLWIGAVVVCIGNWLENYFTRTELQRWCEQSSWGTESETWDADQQRHELAKAMYQSSLAVKAQREALDGRTNYCAFRIELPGLTALGEENLEWAVMRRVGADWSSDHEYWNQAVMVQSEGESGTTLDVTLALTDIDEADAFYVAFRYKPAGSSTWLPENDNAYYYKLVLHQRGNLPMTSANEPQVWQRVAPLKNPVEKLAPLVSTYGFHALIDMPKG